MTLEVVHRHEKLAPESGVEFRPMVPISGVCVRDLIVIIITVVIFLPVIEVPQQCIVQICFHIVIESSNENERLKVALTRHIHCVCQDQYILKMHIKMRHMEPEVLFQCNLCSKMFTRKAHLKRHLRIHNPDKPYKCPHCDYR